MRGTTLDFGCAIGDLGFAVARSNDVHPLYGPNGEVLTKDYSKDHPHHL